jgi:lipopolysaccharide/colanic/teichoic acid biosynthesis glycosyltransferase
MSTSTDGAVRRESNVDYPARLLALKRIFDVAISSIALLALCPLFAMVAVTVKLSGPGPIFYRGMRSGLHGKPFHILKFRTMVTNAEEIGGPSTALHDPRLTSVGKILRKYKMDEFPQLLNILKGDMSFVGPRPQVEKYTNLYSGEEKIILSVRPGLTDYASIQFIDLDAILGDDNVDEKYLREIEPEKNNLRIQYVRNLSFWTDMKILFLTFLQLFKIPSRWNIQG